MVLVDTDVLVDFLRDYPSAIKWFEELRDTPVLVCGLSALELLEGCRNRRETDRLLEYLAPYRIVWPSLPDFYRALADFAVARLKSGIGIIDVLIGETAVGLRLPLHTFNTKHFGALPDLVTI